MATAKTKVVATQEKKAIATTKPAAGTGLAVMDEDFASELAQDGGRGFEEATRDAFAIPFLVVLQDLSPQTKKKMAGYIEGAKPGQIYQSVSQAVEDNIRVIPCHFSQVFIEWVPRDKGGGFVAAYDPIQGAAKARTAVRDGGKMTLPNGNEIYDTRQHFVLTLNPDGSTQPALMALKSTGLKISRRWMSQMQSATIEVNGSVLNPPMFAWSYLVGTEEEANDQGSWYQWMISERQRVTDIQLYRRAKAFGASMAQGQVKVNYEEMERQAEAAGRSTGGRDTPSDLNNEIDA
jgi:hypothetical protein